MMNKYGDTTAERDKFRFKMQDANGKAAALMTLINQQSKYQITKEMYSTGSIPWNETEEISLTANYNMVDTWMMSKRWKEEISQTKYEMKNYFESLAKIHLRLKEDISIHTAIVESWQESSGEEDFFQYPQSIQMSRGKVVIITLELNRIKEKVARAVSLFRMYIHGGFNDNSESDANDDSDRVCYEDSDSDSHQDSDLDSISEKLTPCLYTDV